MQSRSVPYVPRRDGWILAGAALSIYLLFGQHTSYRFDGEILLFSHARGTATYFFFYPFLLDAAVFVLKPIGLSYFRIGCVLSAVGTAVAVFCLHAAGRNLGLDRREAWLAAALAAACPTWMFFATVVAVSGPFLPFAAAGLLAITALVRHGGAARAVFAGLVIGVANLAHPTGLLLITTVPVLAAITNRRGAANGFLLLRHGGLCALCAGVFVVVVPPLLVSTRFFVVPDLPLQTLLDISTRLIHPATWGAMLRDELFVAYIPLAILCGVAMVVRATRRPVLWLLAAATPFFLIALLDTVVAGGEHGRYFSPLAWPAALCILPLVRARRWLIAVLLAAGLAVGIARIVAHDDPAPPRAYAAGFRSIGGPKPILVLGQYSDLGAYFKYLDDLPLCYIGNIILVEDDEMATSTLAAIHQMIEGYFDTGHRIFLPQGTLEALEEASRSGKWPMRGTKPGRQHGDHLRGQAIGPRRMREFLQTTYVLTPVAAKGFAGAELSRRL